MAYRAENIRFNENKSTYSFFRAEEYQGEIHLNIPGEHNVMNSLGVAVFSFELGLSFDDIKKGLQNYKGVRRRFDIKGLY